MHTKNATGPPAVRNPYPLDIHHSGTLWVFDIQYFLQSLTSGFRLPSVPPCGTGCPWRLIDLDRGQVMLKYLASGWCRMMADVDCSGSSWNSSESSTPIRSGSKSAKSLAWSSRFGHAG